MKKYLFIALFVSHLPIYGQVLGKEKFILYEDIIKDLKSTENIKDLENKYNYTFVLLLDSTNIELIEKTGYQHIEQFRDYVPSLSLSKQTDGFVTDKKDIKEIFLDKNSLNRILECSKTYNSPDILMTVFDYPIYIKENKAVFETSGPTWSDTYFVRLENDNLQINWIGGIIE